MVGLEFSLLFHEGAARSVRYIVPAVPITNSIRTHVVRVRPRLSMRLQTKQTFEFSEIHSELANLPNFAAKFCQN